MIRKYATFLVAFVRMVTLALPKWQRIHTLSRVSSRLVPIVPSAAGGVVLKFYTPSKISAYWPNVGLTAEPDTLRWIDGFAPSASLLDIGANVGVYSLYAAAKGHRVMAFEPNPFTFNCLMNNLHINGLSDDIEAFCIAVADRMEMGRFFMGDADPGSTGNVFGAGNKSVIVKQAGSFAVSMLALTIDDIVRIKGDGWFPEHIKIDVDSIEEKIIAGASATLADPRLRSVLIEIAGGNDQIRQRGRELIAAIERHGFAVQDDHASFSGNRLFVRCPA